MPMPDRSTRDFPGYSRISKAMHWIVALLVFVTWPLGLMIGFVKYDVKTLQNSFRSHTATEREKT